MHHDGVWVGSSVELFASASPFLSIRMVENNPSVDASLASTRGVGRAVFLPAIALLCVCGVATYLSFAYFAKSERWVSHTQEVRAAVGELEAKLNAAGRARTTYLLSGDEADLSEYRAAAPQVIERLQQLKKLAGDNAVQVENCAQLESTISTRLQAWEDSIAQKQQNKPVTTPRSCDRT